MFDVIAIGTATRDVFLTSPLFKVLRDPKHLEKIGFKTGEAQCFALGAKVEVQKIAFATGGGAANAAVTFARQGFQAAVIARLGDDELGKTVVAGLKKEKVKPLVHFDKSLGTAYSTILISPDGERTILVYRGASEVFQKKEIPFRKLKAKWAYIVPGQIALSLMSDIVNHLKKNGVKIALNPSRHYLELGVERLKPIFNRLDAVIMNREEASYLTGVSYNNERGIFKKLDDVVPGIAVMTDGSRGAKVSDGKYLYSAGIFSAKGGSASGGKEKIVDRTGAGDAFGSGFVAGLMAKNDINFALRLAAANATSVVEHIGAQEGILTKSDFSKPRFKYLDLDVEPL